MVQRAKLLHRSRANHTQYNRFRHLMRGGPIVTTQTQLFITAGKKSSASRTCALHALGPHCIQLGANWVRVMGLAFDLWLDLGKMIHTATDTHEHAERRPYLFILGLKLVSRNRLYQTPSSCWWKCCACYSPIVGNLNHPPIVMLTFSGR